MSTAALEIRGVPTKDALFHQILLATDLSGSSERALLAALELADENHSQLTLVHVVNSDWRYEVLENPPELALEQVDVQKRLRAFADKLAPGRNIPSTLIKHGPVAQSIASAALHQGADLVVIGTHGRRGLSKLALGSVAEELLRIAPCPVMAVGPHATLGLQRNRSHAILYATDFGKGSMKALPLALSLATARRAKLILLHMMTPMPLNSNSMTAYAPTAAAVEDVQQWESSARQRCLNELKSCLPCGAGLEAEPEYVIGTDLFPEGILTAAEKFNVDLIVMGASHGGSAKMLAHIPWTAVHEVVRNAHCPVLTVAA